MKKEEYWAGFRNDRLCWHYIKGNKRIVVPSIFFNFEDAKLFFEDVRLVEIREIKKKKKS